MSRLSRAKLSIQDPLKVWTRWSSDERMIHKTAKAFSQDFLKPRIRDDFCKYKGARSKEMIKEMGNLGFLGTVSQGFSNSSYGIIAREIEAVDSAYRSCMSVQSSLVIYPINKYGSPSVKDKYLDNLYAGNIIGAFGLTEPMHGSDPSSMVTTAKKQNNYYVLNGEKMWITNSPIADVFVVWAKDLDNNKISGFVLDRNDNGISTPVIDNKFSLNASVTGQIVMQDVKIPLYRKLEIEGLAGPFSCLNQARFGISWGVLGAAADCLEVALEYADTRKQFGKHLSEFQLIQHRLADLSGRVGICLAACQQLAESRDAETDCPEMVSILKAQNCTLALETAQTCREILGANGIVSDYSPIRHLANLQSVATYEGTTDIHHLIVGRALTGSNAFF